MRRIAWMALGGLLLSTMSACGGPQRRQERAVDALLARDDAPAIEMDTVVIRGRVHEDGSVSTTSTDLHALFEEASAYYKAKDHRNALRLYEALLDATDDPVWSRAALFNAGLALEGLEAWEEAGDNYAMIIALWPTSEDARDAYFRYAETLAYVGEFQRIPPLMERALQRVDLTLDRRLEALVRRGTAYVEMRKFADAERELRAALRLDEATRQADMAAGRIVRRGRIATVAIAQANFLLGRIYHEIFSEIRMVLPVERYKLDLADKERLYKQALDWYTLAVRTGDIYWAPHAGYMIGKLYEDYYFDILASEVPAHFDEEQQRIYFDAMRAFLEPGLTRSIQLYEQALAMAYRMGVQDGVVDDMVNAIERLKTYLSERVGWEEEHRAIMAGTHPHSPHVAASMVFREDLSTREQNAPRSTPSPF